MSNNKNSVEQEMTIKLIYSLFNDVKEVNNTHIKTAKELYAVVSDLLNCYDGIPLDITESSKKIFEINKDQTKILNLINSKLLSLADIETHHKNIEIIANWVKCISKKEYTKEDIYFIGKIVKDISTVSDCVIWGKRWGGIVVGAIVLLLAFSSFGSSIIKLLKGAV